MESESKPVANINAEKSVLGGILLDNNAYIEAAECLTPEDFSTDANRKIFNRMVGLMESGRPVDQVTLPDELERNKEYAKIGGPAYIASLVDGLPDRPSIAEYVAIVKDKSLLRRIIRVCELGIARAQAQDKPALTLLGQLETTITKIAGAPRSTAKPLKELALTVLNEMTRERSREEGVLIGIPSGIARLDEMLGGIRESELWIAGGLPAKGKTSFGLEFGVSATRCDIPTCFFSLEMKDTRIVRRILAAHTPAGSAGSRDAKKIYSAEQWVMVQEGAAKLGDLPLYVDDTSGLSIPELRARIRLYKKRFNLKFAIVDYVRLMTGPGKDLRDTLAGLPFRKKVHAVNTCESGPAE